MQANSCGGKDGETAHDLSINGENTFSRDHLKFFSWVGVQASVGAKITLHMGFWASKILDWVQPSVVVGSTKTPVKQGCLLPDGTLVKKDGYSRGTVYHGTQKIVNGAQDYW